MKVYEFQSATGRSVFCRFSGQHHRPANGAAAGHRFEFDEINRELRFFDPIDERALHVHELRYEHDVDTINDWLKTEIAAGTIAEVNEAPAAPANDVPPPSKKSKATAPQAPATPPPPAGGTVPPPPPAAK